MSELTVVNKKDLSSVVTDPQSQFVTMRIQGQLFGLPILSVHDILGEQVIGTIPLSPDMVAGSLNLRGKVVTAIDVRTCIGLPSYKTLDDTMHVVVEHDYNSYSLIFDQVGEVLSLSMDDFESNPPTLDSKWRDLSAGIYRLPKELLVVLDIDKIINLSKEAECEPPNQAAG